MIYKERDKLVLLIHAFYHSYFDVCQAWEAVIVVQIIYKILRITYFMC